MAYSWSTANYIAEVENSSDPGLQEYQVVELEFIQGVNDLAAKTVIDVGAGYGRVLPKLAPLVKTYIAVEQDKDEIQELGHRVAKQPNTKLIAGSGNKLVKLIPDDTEKPLLLSLQNTLGPWDGNRDEAIRQVSQVASRGNGEAIISMFCQESLEDWGIQMYATIKGLVGIYNSLASDISKGIFRTDNGYESHWFSAAEREAIKQTLGGVVVREVLDHKFHIFQISFASV